jgi:hypothetical protein
MTLFTHLALPLAFVIFGVVAVLLALRFVTHSRPQSDSPLPQLNVRKLVPAHSSAIASDPTAGNVRLAFRAHCLFQNDCSIVMLSWGDIVSAPMSTAQRTTQLCELYSRAIFESSFAKFFDGEDPRTDVIVLTQIAEAFGHPAARQVHDMVAERGVVLRRLVSNGSGAAAPA